MSVQQIALVTLKQLCQRTRERDEARKLLKEAAEHLDYCGYGDTWERERAGDLRERLTKALSQWEDAQ